MIIVTDEEKTHFFSLLSKKTHNLKKQNTSAYPNYTTAEMEDL